MLRSASLQEKRRKPKTDDALLKVVKEGDMGGVGKRTLLQLLIRGLCNAKRPGGGVQSSLLSSLIFIFCRRA